MYNYDLYMSLRHSGRDRPQGDGTLQPLSLQLTAHTVGLFYVAIDKQVGRATPTRAVEPCPAIPALLPGVDVQSGKAARQLLIEGAIIKAAQLVVLVAYKLVAGVNVPLRGDSHILAARPAAPQALDHAGALGQIHVPR